MNFKMLKDVRKSLKLKNLDILKSINSKNLSTIYHIEKNYTKNIFVKYIMFIRKKGINLNSLFDKIIENEKSK
jgi:hypothetical protein